MTPDAIAKARAAIAEARRLAEWIGRGPISRAEWLRAQADLAEAMVGLAEAQLTPDAAPTVSLPPHGNGWWVAGDDADPRPPHPFERAVTLGT